MSTIKLNFVLSARDLPSKIRGSTGLSSIPDPYIKIWHKDAFHPEWTELTHTKHVINCANPDFQEVVSFDYKQRTGQVWRLEVLDYDVMNKDDVIGEVVVDVDQYYHGNKQFVGKLPNGGSIIIKGTTAVRFSIQVEHLPKLDSGSGSDPFVECSWGYGKDGETHRFHKTETIDDAQNAKWNEVISFDKFIPATNQYFTFKVSDEDTLKDDVIGEVSFSVDTFVKTNQTAVYRLNEAKNKATITIKPVQ